MKPSLLDALELDAVHLVGHSLGGSVVMDLAARPPGRALSITLVAPVSPYGFGGTKPDGTPARPTSPALAAVPPTPTWSS